MKYQPSEPTPRLWGLLSGLPGVVVGAGLGAAWWGLGGTLAELLTPAAVPAVIVAAVWIGLLALGLNRKQPPQRAKFGLASALGFGVAVGFGWALVLLFLTYGNY